MDSIDGARPGRNFAGFFTLTHICLLLLFYLSSLVGFISTQTLFIPLILKKTMRISVVDPFRRNRDEIMR
jgi:hypothetical protein